MERGSPSRLSWANEVEEEEAAAARAAHASSPSWLNPEATPFIPSPRSGALLSASLYAAAPSPSLDLGREGRISFSDSEEDISEPNSPPAAGKGKAPCGRRRRRTRWKRRCAGGFMADARRHYDRASPPLLAPGPSPHGARVALPQSPILPGCPPRLTTMGSTGCRAATAGAVGRAPRRRAPRAQYRLPLWGSASTAFQGPMSRQIAPTPSDASNATARAIGRMHARAWFQHSAWFQHRTAKRPRSAGSNTAPDMESGRSASTGRAPSVLCCCALPLPQDPPPPLPPPSPTGQGALATAGAELGQGHLRRGRRTGYVVIPRTPEL